MSRMKSLFAVLILTAIAGFVPKANAAGPTFKIVIAGSSAMWQSMALATYKNGACVAGGVNGCAHYASASSFNLTDTRPTPAVSDGGAIWIVWDHVTSDPNCTTACSVWAYIKVDSVVGQRCYFAQPHCNVNVAAFPAGGAISTALWGADSAVPATIQAKFLASIGPLATAAATDIRPEDGVFATCRVNSALDAVNYTGLGYNTNNPSGTCPANGSGQAFLEGTSILSALSASTAHVLAYNISGHDPFNTTKAIPVSTTVAVGAAPIVFVAERDHELAGIKDATDSELQSVFSGANCDANAFGLAAGTIEAYLREPLSGTENTTDSTVFHYPGSAEANSPTQETGVNPANANNNPLQLPCTAGGSRFRGIGTAEIITSVQKSFTNHGHDGIGYAFFSYGNVSKLGDQAAFGYLTLNGVDGIWHKYGTTIDPGQPAVAGELPTGNNPGGDLPATCLPVANQFPCAEKRIWSGNLSFPNLRSGQYRSWSVLRLVSDGAALAVAKLIATGSNAWAVAAVPDYVPLLPTVVSVPVVTGGDTQTDPGLQLLRSHYTQAGVAPFNQNNAGPPIKNEAGGDMGGCILHGFPGTTAIAFAETDSTTKLAQSAPGSECIVVP